MAVATSPPRPANRATPSLRGVVLALFVANDPQVDLDARRRHRRHRHLWPEPTRQVQVGAGYLGRVGQAQPHSPDVGLVLDPGHRRLDGNGISDVPRRSQHIVEGARSREAELAERVGKLRASLG